MKAIVRRIYWRVPAELVDGALSYCKALSGVKRESKAYKSPQDTDGGMKDNVEYGIYTGTLFLYSAGKAYIIR